jgi:hypothetical protein
VHRQVQVVEVVAHGDVVHVHDAVDHLELHVGDGLGQRRAEDFVGRHRAAAELGRVQATSGGGVLHRLAVGRHGDLLEAVGNVLRGKRVRRDPALADLHRLLQHATRLLRVLFGGFTGLRDDDSLELSGLPVGLGDGFEELLAHVFAFFLLQRLVIVFFVLCVVWLLRWLQRQGCFRLLALQDDWKLEVVGVVAAVHADPAEIVVGGAAAVVRRVLHQDILDIQAVTALLLGRQRVGRVDTGAHIAARTVSLSKSNAF